MRHRIFVLCDWDPLFWGKIRSSVYYFWEPLFFFFVIVTESKTFWVVNFLCWEPCWTCFPIGLLIRLNLIPDVYTKNYWTIAQYLTISARLFLVNFFLKPEPFESFQNYDETNCICTKPLWKNVDRKAFGQTFNCWYKSGGSSWRRLLLSRYISFARATK